MTDKDADKLPAPDESERERINEARRQIEEALRRANATDTSPPDADEMDQPGVAADSFAGYKIVREIHRGGQGIVYQAVQKSTRRKVAIKVMKEGPFAGPSDKSRFEREIQILGQLRHPNIVTIHESGEAAGHFYYVMDYISGQPLDVHMASREHSIEETLQLFAKICDAVNAAHLRGVIHRDLKPGNIRIDTEGEPRVLDFGLAKVATGEAEASLMTMTGQFLGSLPWASPEQAEGIPNKIDIRTDVYSLGVILYQMLTGKFPYDVVGNIRDVMERIMKTEPTRPSTVRRQIDDEVETIALKCLRKQRDRRYQSAGELGRDIGHYLAGEPIEAKRDSGWYVLKKTFRRYRVPAAVAASFLVLLIGFAFTMSLLYRRAVTAEQVADVSRVQAEREADNAFRAASILRDLVSTYESGESQLPSLRRFAQRIDQEFAGQPELRASLHHALGISFYNLGIEDAVTTETLTALDIRIRTLGPDHLDTLKSMDLLVEVLRRKGQRSEAQELLRQIVDIARGTRAEEDPDTLRWVSELVWVLAKAGKHEKADQLNDETLASRRRAFAAAPNEWAGMALLNALRRAKEFEEFDRVARNLQELRERNKSDRFEKDFDNPISPEVMADIYDAMGKLEGNNAKKP